MPPRKAAILGIISFHGLLPATMAGAFTPRNNAHFRARRRTRPGAMPSVFTAFVRSQQGAETPNADLLHDAWNGLQAALGGELKRRGLWNSPPCYLGVYGHERWEAE